MVRHIVLWKLADNAGGKTKKENMALMKEKLEGLVGQVDGLLTAEVTENFTRAGLTSALSRPTPTGRRWRATRTTPPT